MSEKPKPCPFCGSEVKLDYADWGKLWFSDCTNNSCAAQGPYGDTKEQAIQAWNHRPREQELEAEIEELCEDLRTLMGLAFENEGYISYDNIKLVESRLKKHERSE